MSSADRRRRRPLDRSDDVRRLRRRRLRRRACGACSREEATAARRPRELIDWAIGPVWEANHVWLIFVLVVLWTGFSSAFEAIFSTLFIPLSLAALGIVLRGSGFAFQHTARRARGRALAVALFGLASVLTPFFMGTVVGAIAGGRVPVGNATGDAVTSWLNPLSLVIGALFVATGAYLVGRVPRQRRPPRRRPRPRALLRATARSSPRSSPGRSRPPASSPCTATRGTSSTASRATRCRSSSSRSPAGSRVLVLLHRGARRGARPLAVGAVAAVIWGWGVAQYPYLLPQKLTISEAAAPSATLTGLLIVFGIAVLLVLPSLGLLFTLAQRNLVEETSRPTLRPSGDDGGATSTGH